MYTDVVQSPVDINVILLSTDIVYVYTIEIGMYINRVENRLTSM